MRTVQKFSVAEIPRWWLLLGSALGGTVLRGGEAAGSRLAAELGETPESLKTGRKAPASSLPRQSWGWVRAEPWRILAW